MLQIGNTNAVFVTSLGITASHAHLLQTSNKQQVQVNTIFYCLFYRCCKQIFLLACLSSQNKTGVSTFYTGPRISPME